MKIQPFVRYQLPFLLWLLLIFVLSAIPNVPSVKFPVSPDKVAHAGIYFVLCLLSRRAFFHQQKISWLRGHSVLLALALTVLYGVIDEIHQVYVPGRTPDVYDALADAFGGLMSAGWIWFSSLRRPRT